MDQMCLEIIDLFVCPSPVIFCAESFNTFYHNTTVPGTIVDRNVTVFRNIVPETPQIMMCLLHTVRCRSRTYFVASWIHVAGNAFDRTAFTCCIPALETKHHRNSLTVQFTMQLLYLFLKLVQLLLIVFLF